MWFEKGQKLQYILFTINAFASHMYKEEHLRRNFHILFGVMLYYFILQYPLQNVLYLILNNMYSLFNSTFLTNILMGI